MQPRKNKNDKEDFIAFINTFMSRINPDYSKYALNLYACRCALVHTYGQSDATQKLNFIPSFTPNTPPFGEHLYYYIVEHDNPLEREKKFGINLSSLVTDIIISVELFFKTNTTNIQDLQLWWSKLFYYQGLKSHLNTHNISKGKNLN